MQNPTGITRGDAMCPPEMLLIQTIGVYFIRFNQIHNKISNIEFFCCCSYASSLFISKLTIQVISVIRHVPRNISDLSNGYVSGDIPDYCKVWCIRPGPYRNFRSHLMGLIHGDGWGALYTGGPYTWYHYTMWNILCAMASPCNHK